MTYDTDKVTNPTTHTWGITPDEWTELATYIRQNYPRDVHGVEVALALYQYGRLNGLYRMLFYVRKARKNNVPAREIIQKVLHDLNNFRNIDFIPQAVD